MLLLTATNRCVVRPPSTYLIYTQ